MNTLDEIKQTALDLSTQVDQLIVSVQGAIERGEDTREYSEQLPDAVLRLRAACELLARKNGQNDAEKVYN